MASSQDLFNLYREAILKELQILTGSINDGQVLMKIRFADDIALMVETKIKPEDLLEKILKKRIKKSLASIRRQNLSSLVSEIMVLGYLSDRYLVDGHLIEWTFRRKCSGVLTCMSQHVCVLFECK